jgi:hypothetical protein
MKRTTLILGLSMLMLAAIVLAACGGSSPTSTQGQPRIFFYEDSVDVGKIPAGAELDYTFQFVNMGDATLVIEDASAKAIEGC